MYDVSNKLNQYQQPKQRILKQTVFHNWENESKQSTCRRCLEILEWKYQVIYSIRGESLGGKKRIGSIAVKFYGAGTVYTL